MALYWEYFGLHFRFLFFLFTHWIISYSKAYLREMRFEMITLRDKFFAILYLPLFWIQKKNMTYKKHQVLGILFKKIEQTFLKIKKNWDVTKILLQTLWKRKKVVHTAHWHNKRLWETKIKAFFSLWYFALHERYFFSIKTSLCFLNNIFCHFYEHFFLINPIDYWVHKFGQRSSRHDNCSGENMQISELEAREHTNTHMHKSKYTSKPLLFMEF